MKRERATPVLSSGLMAGVCVSVTSYCVHREKDKPCGFFFFNMHFFS